jgi:serine/threonine-protein kinase RsbW
MAEVPNVHLYLSNRPENVLLVREMLAGVAEGIDLYGGDLDDIRTAVTEACNNVALHAYEGREGPLEIEVYTHLGAFEVVVRDRGIGITPRAANQYETTLGLGLPVIQALVHKVQFTDLTGNGTEVRMQFATREAHPLHAPAQNGFELPTVEQADLPTTTGVTIAPTYLARTVLPRVLSALAVNADFSTERISDVQMFADALVAQAPESGKGRVSVTVSAQAHCLQLRIGPLASGRARSLLMDCAVEGLGSVIGKLIDGHWVSGSDSHEMLAVQMVDRR